MAKAKAAQLIDEHVPLDQCKKAIAALLEHESKKAQKQAETELLPGKEQNVWLVLAVKKMHAGHRLKPQKIPIVHPLVDPRISSICLITKDPQREYKDLLESHNIKFISRVVGLEKLKGKFKPYDARRMLLKENDLFLADERVVPLLPKLLGVKWFDAKKQPIPVCLTRKDLKGELERAISSTYMHQNQGTCTSIKIGTLSQTPAQILANIQSALPAIVQNVKEGWDNIQSFNIKTSTSASLPVWSCSLDDEGRWEGLGVKDDDLVSDEDEEMDEEEEDSSLLAPSKKSPAAAKPKKKRGSEDDEKEQEKPRKKAKTSDSAPTIPISETSTISHSKATSKKAAAPKLASSVPISSDKPSSVPSKKKKQDEDVAAVAIAEGKVSKKNKKANTAAGTEAPADVVAKEPKKSKKGEKVDSVEEPVAPPTTAKKGKGKTMADAVPAAAEEAQIEVEVPKKKQKGPKAKADSVAASEATITTPTPKKKGPKAKADSVAASEVTTTTPTPKKKASKPDSSSGPTSTTPSLTAEELKQKRGARAGEKKKEKIVKGKSVGKGAKDSFLGKKAGRD